MTHSLNIDAAVTEIHGLNGYLSEKCPNLRLGIVRREEVIKNPSIYHTKKKRKKNKKTRRRRR
jgi:hypothetical protein